MILDRTSLFAGRAVTLFAAALLLLTCSLASYLTSVGSRVALTCDALSILGAVAFGFAGLISLLGREPAPITRHGSQTEAGVLAMAEASPDAILLLQPVFDRDGKVQDFRSAFSNTRAQQMFAANPRASRSGGPGSASIASSFPFLATPANLQYLQDVLLTGARRSFTLAVQEPGLAVEWLRVSIARLDTGLVVTLVDLTSTRQAERQMCRQIQTDALTGLPNRALLDDRIQQAIRRAKRNKQAAAVLLLNIDDLAEVNRAHGRAAGDHVLKVVAQRLTEAVRSTDSVLRLGSDEFVIVFPDVFTHSPITDFARKIMTSLFAPIPWDGQNLQVTVTLGVAMYPEQGTMPETLLVQADIERNRRRKPAPLTIASSLSALEESRPFSMMLQ